MKMEFLISTTLDLLIGINNYIRCTLISIYCNKNNTHRKLRVYLNYDKSAKTPIATTEGDSQMILNYVS